MRPLVTVVTPCYNSVDFIEDTIKSVVDQSYEPIEYIVVDGGSTDGTVDVVRRHSASLQLISEPDTGQANAINKGWRKATGEILAWLNADDLYCPDTVETAVNYLNQNPDVYWVYGDAQFLDYRGASFPLRNPIYQWDYDRLLNSHVYITQPTVFIRREVLDVFGYLREDLHYGMDYEYWLRIGRRFPGTFVSTIQVKVKWHSRAKTASGGKKRILEMDRIVREYGATRFPKIMQYEWELAYLEDLLRQLMRGNWNEVAQDANGLAQYPAYLPRALGKMILRWVVPPRAETRIRQWLSRAGLLNTNR